MNVHEMWSNEELDRALGVLNAEVSPGDQALAAARAELMAAAGAPEPVQHKTKRHWGRWVAAVAVVAATVTSLQVIPFSDEPPVATAAASLLINAADKIPTSDPVIKPGQYLHIEEHWWGATASISDQNASENFAYRFEMMVQRWIPAKRTQEWLLRTEDTGRREWISGRTAQREEQAAVPKAIPGDHRARCGDINLLPGEQPCQRKGNWSTPSAEFLASLPTDPRQLHDLIREQFPAPPPGSGAEDRDAPMLSLVANIVWSGQASAQIRANLYRALALIPGLVVDDRTPNADGRIGVGLGLDREGQKYELILDTESGQLIGERTTQTKANPAIPVGTVTRYTAVKIGVVDKMGDKPGQ
nr:CU044_5270 family protein [Kibdelosporangium sp. MJ126-NF4]CEL23335.1 hypothetical protein [Kibdelosporangium sp. MJ126-NF4]CTQ94497.1 hypothetical protein [Kibdelosporangium sp. MJ126-NF4]